MLDLKKTTYTLIIIMKDGTELDITGAVTALTWAQMDNEIAAKCNFSAGQVYVKDKKNYLSALIELCSMVVVKADGVERFRGIVTTWEYESSTTREINVTAHDLAYYLLRSQDYNYWTEGKSTSSIIQDICKKWNVKVSLECLASVKQPKTMFKSETLGDQITSVMNEAKRKYKSKPWTMRMEGDKLRIFFYGSNKEICKFTNTTNTLSTKSHMSLEGMVTRVQIYGKADDDGRSSLHATSDGKTEYGVLQKVIYRDGTGTLQDAQNEAKQILEENGVPDETYTVNSVDVPMVQKGDLIKIEAGDLSGDFYVKSVTHDAVQRQMNMEVRRTSENTVTVKSSTEDASVEEESSSSKSLISMWYSVVVNGPVYKDENAKELDHKALGETYVARYERPGVAASINLMSGSGTSLYTTKASIRKV